MLNLGTFWLISQSATTLSTDYNLQQYESHKWWSQLKQFGWIYHGLSQILNDSTDKKNKGKESSSELYGLCAGQLQ